MSAPDGPNELPWWHLALPGGEGGALLLDQANGLPGALELPPSTGLGPLCCSTTVALHVGGGEARALGGGLDYPGVELLGTPKLVSVEDCAGEPAGGRRARCELPGWSLAIDYRLAAILPRARIGIELVRLGGDPRPLRNVELELALSLDPAEWSLHAPGNRVVPGTCLADLDGELWISPVTGSLGSLGLVALSHRSAAACLVLWPFSRREIASIALVAEPDGVRLRLGTNLAADPDEGEVLTASVLGLDALGASWAAMRGAIRPALRSLGVGSPDRTPSWAAAAAIYEVQVGRSVFSGGWSYEPYPRLEDVTADLGRVAGLGFTAIQLMPRQPYPSYNVCDYEDLDTTYGGEEALRELVARAHELGLRVVLDIVLHGVLDRRSIGDALGRVRASGILDEPAPAVADVFADTPESRAALQRAWCQHIVDFAPYWAEGAPEVHPLTLAH
ncbi:MAG TPA: alpha-amylase family protein, partial [Acidimicrobiales bacterium]|nr:alpha-amylase family protein [Acidimicrobiales bacterium]